MKTALSTSKGILCLLILLNSCISSKNSLETNIPVSEKPKETAACFVQMNDGSIINYSTLKLITGIFKTPHLLADGNISITGGEIKAYQSKSLYAVSQKEFTTVKPSYVAVNALPGFAIRVARGKLNVYSLKYYNGHNATEKYFLQSGDEGQIVAYTPELMIELVKDNSDALVFFNTKNKVSSIPQKLLATADIYNNQRFISKN